MFGTSTKHSPSGLSTDAAFSRNCCGSSQMLQDRPEGHRVELPAAEILFQEIAAHDSDPAALRVIQRRAAHVGTQHLVAARKALVQLEQERPGRTTDIQHGAALAVLAEQSQFPLESHRRVVTLQLGRRKIVIRPRLVIVFARKQTPPAPGWHRSSCTGGSARAEGHPFAGKPPPHCGRIPGSLGIPGRWSWADNSSCLRHAAVIEGGRAAIKEILFRHRMKLAARIKSWWSRTEKPLHLRHGELGERAAKKPAQAPGPEVPHRQLPFPARRD